MAEGLHHALQWIHWNRLELAVSGTGQPRPLLTEAALQFPTASAWAPTSGTSQKNFLYLSLTYPDMAGSSSINGPPQFTDTCANNVSDILFKISVKMTIALLKCTSNLEAIKPEDCLEFLSCKYEVMLLPSLELLC